ncbi:LacI family transcriptional regulator [Mycetocola tolaasinivorans]|uniref:LacI family transcriptional regulator n=1 Tax=Mycetocola tolaasinivorans TaxID=76635 RepID=A0A3L7A063_9MICO|nr:LacI family DNA-binding transcriptional regulator [Mycetocola tolaasinivorans]RLP73683.1 LacI family transcriptional regulator [Mycetocola tolaasinivorans]
MSTEPVSSSTRPATIHDVARESGFAASTVSRALSNPGRVNVQTREKILAIARALNYTPNSQARALTSGQTRSIAVLVSDITNPFYFGLIRGTQQQLKAANYLQMLVDTAESSDSEAATIDSLRRSADGAILTASRLSDQQLVSLSERMPLVAINRHVPGIPAVIIDTPFGIDQALDHLASLGHRRITYVSGPDMSWSNERRWQRLEKTAQKLGVQPVRTREYAPSLASGAAAAEAMINSESTACVVFNDLIAIGMLERFRERGVRVPEDISVVGCDDIFGASFCNPPLTTLTAPIERAGRMAVSMLLSRLEAGPDSPPPPPMLLPTHLTVRKSTGPARQR